MNPDPQQNSSATVGARRTADSRSRTRRPLRSATGVILTLALGVTLVAGCGSSGSKTATGTSATPGTTIAPVMVDGALPRFPDGTVLRVVTHDSFAVSADVLDQFTAATGVKVELLPSGDAGAMVNAAILTKDDPQGDVLFGIDENLLAAAFDSELFQRYGAGGLAGVPQSYRVDDQHRVTPIDHGDICVNFDRSWFADRQLSAPSDLSALTDGRYRSTLVVEDPSSSSPGLSFLLATIATFGGAEDTGANPAWLQYWRNLRANDVSVVDSWETAYYSSFSGSSGEGDRPLVVSYASSPPAEVTDTSLPVDESPTGALASTCYRQIEFAGVLSGANEPKAAAAFIEFMLMNPFQRDMPGQMYVYPVVTGTELPATFAKYTVPVADPLALPYAVVAANRDRWITQWASLFR